MDNNNKGQTIFLSVIGIATLLVAIIGATFAWFSVNVDGNDDASSIIVTTAILGSIEFQDGSLINLSNIRPEGDPNATKRFKIINETPDLTRPIEYQIHLEVTANTLSPEVNNASNAAIAGDWFVHQITALTEDLEHVEATAEDTYVTNANFVAVPTAADTILGDTDHKIGSMHGIATHVYQYEIVFKDSSLDQNSGQGKNFSGRLQVSTLNTLTP